MMTILDVRTGQEYVSGALPGALHADVAAVDFVERVRHLVPARSAVACYCRRGQRSERAAELLRRLGYDAVNIGGIESGLRVRSQDGGPGGSGGPGSLGAVDWRALVGNLMAPMVRGREGQVLTEGAIMSGYAFDGSALRQAYQANPAAIDHWAAQLDVQRIIDTATTGEVFAGTASLARPAALIGAGAVAGLLVSRVLR